MNVERVYTLQQAADILQVSLETIRRYVRNGKLKAARIGKAYRVTETQLKAFLDENTAN